uniref:CRAL-TRIO domain-containing protein n=1 Tax=Glossina morsitans morsitans TaxID=37546 RepID=A0A1B0FLS6_GLOMM
MVQPGKLNFDEDNFPYVDLGTVRMCMDRQEAPDWALEVAREELRETPDIMKESFEKLNQLLDEEKHLIVPREETYLKIYLRPAHYYPESAIKRIKNFFNTKIKHPEACRDLLPSKLKHVFDADVLQLLPVRDQHGRRMITIHAGKKWKPSQVPLIDLFRGVQVMIWGAMVEPLSQICGGLVIIDMEDLSMTQIMQFTPSFAAMLLDYVQECICLRLKAVHIVNNSYIFNILFNIFKPFIKEKLRKRLHFHGKDFKSLHKHIDKSCLPAKYEGTASWEMPHSSLTYELFHWYEADYEKAETYGFTEEYKKKK